MLMKRQNWIFLTLTLGVLLSCGSIFAAAPKSCFDVKDNTSLLEFKKVYIDLQNKLNYEGTDAYLDKKGVVQTKAHAKGTPYPGKEFEAAMFLEYQNSLRKVGRLYQSAKFEGNENFKSNRMLVDFMAAIEDKKSDSQDFIKKTDIDQVIKALKEASSKKFGSTDTDKKYVITDQDEYLLRKLLTHAQDRICNLATFNKTGKPLTGQFTVEYLQQVKNAPLNRLVGALKNAKLGKDSKIDLLDSSPLTAKLMDPNLAIDPAAAINSAVASDLEKLGKWIQAVKAKNPKCFDYMKTKDFANSIQLNIQSCNLGEFLETMSEGNYSNLEAILHYINSNEKFLNNPQAKAETALDEVGLEGYISTTFNNLTSRVVCTTIENSAGDKKRFIRNLPYDPEKGFDKTSIICTANKKQLSAAECAKQYELVSDEFGRGLELKSKKTNLKNVAISISKDGANCSDLSLDTEEEPQPEPPKPQPEPQRPEPQKPEDPKADACEEIYGKDRDKGYIYKLTADKKACDVKRCDDVEGPNGKTPVWNEATQDCSASSAPSCEKNFFFSVKANNCVECKPKQDDKDFTWDKNEEKCVPAKPRVTESEDQKKCEEKQKKYVKESGKRSLRYKWDAAKKECVDLKPDPKEDDEEEGEHQAAPDQFPWKQAPGRFQPLQQAPDRMESITPGSR